MEEADQVSRARLLAATQRESGLLLHILATSPLGSLLDFKSLSIALSLRVGADICEPHMSCYGRRMNARGSMNSLASSVLGDTQDMRA